MARGMAAALCYLGSNDRLTQTLNQLLKQAPQPLSPVGANLLTQTTYFS